MQQTAFGPFTFDCATGELFRDGEPVALPPKATLVLQALISSPGRLVSHEELYDVAWDGTVVEYDQGLYTCIRQIRRVLSDDARRPRYIETVPKRGYRFCYPLSSKQPRKHRSFAGVPIRVAAAAAVFLLLLGVAVVGAISLQTRVGDLSPGAIALGDFRIDGFEVSTGGIDQELELAVRRSLAAQGVNPDHSDASYVLTGLIAPADEGALFHAALVRLSDYKTVWEGSYNPFCREIEGDPIRVIGRLVARTVIANVEPNAA